MQRTKLQITGTHLAVPVWTNKHWDRYHLEMRNGSDELIYTFLLPEGSHSSDVEACPENPDYYAYLPMISSTGASISGEITLSCDAPYLNAESFRWADGDTATGQISRLHYHAPYGSINDPNGLIYQDGLWHIYHQHNPLDNIWGNMTWGHAVSKDLVNYVFMGDVLFPEDDGVMFSGCGLENKRGLLGLPKDTLLYYYTHAPLDKMDGEKHTSFSQRLAFSTDGGYTLVKKTDWSIPTIAGEDRDPKVFWHDQSNSYVMILYLDDNRFGILRSDDLEHWKLSSEMEYSPMWECPDLFRLTENMWAFMSADGYYYIGSFDGFRFTPQTPQRSLYAGKLPYAAQSFSGTGDRIISIAWLRTVNHGENWHGMLSVPREFTLGEDEDGYYIRQQFAKEVEGYITEKDDKLVIEDEYIKESLDMMGRQLSVEQLF